MNKILERIERQAGVPGLATILAEKLDATDLQSLLLEVFRIRARREPSAILADYQANRFVHPATISPIRLLEWEKTACSNLPREFELLELSPACPLGTSSVVAPVDQNWIVSTIRNTEVVSDSTNVLAIECALRRRKQVRTRSKSAEAVHLAASHRLLRGQSYDNPSLVSHFRAFTLCSAGRDQGGYKFEMETLVLHIQFYLRALQAFWGGDIPIQVSVTGLEHNVHPEIVESGLLSPIRNAFSNVTCLVDDQRTGGRGYYTDLCFHVHAMVQGQLVELVDGGSVDWTRKLLSDAKERLVISGIGSERVIKLFDER